MDKKPKKQLVTFSSRTVRGITDEVNVQGIQKEDIVQVLRTDNDFVLLYYI
jgi:hypothetical protein